MSVSDNQIKPYRIGLIVSGLLNVVLIVLLLVSRGSKGQTAVSPTSQANDEVAAVPGATSTSAPPTATVADEPTPTATVMATATTQPAQEPTASATAQPTEPPAPTPTATIPPTPTATVQPTPVPGPNWLRYYNQFRTQAGLPQLSENSSWSAGSLAHSQ